MRLALAVLVFVLAGVIAAAASPVSALQETPAEEPSPTPTESEEEICQIGQVCSELGDIRQERRSGPINDPPGNYVRSLITIGAIGLLVGAYLFLALTGRAISSPLRRLRNARR